MTTPAPEAGGLERGGDAHADNALAAFTGRLVAFAQRWFPDAYTFVLIAVMIVAGGSILHGGSPIATSRAFYDGFWNLIPFTMQMALVAIGGYVVATSPPMRIILERLARIPSSGRSAVVLVGLVSIALSLLNWGLSLIFSGLFVRAIARREDIRLDYRAAGAAAYLGLGAAFTFGLSSSAAQLQATPESIPPALLSITGVIPYSETIFTWQNGVMIALATLVSLAICFLTAPPGSRAKTARDLGISVSDEPAPDSRVGAPIERLEYSPVLTVLIVVIAFAWLVDAIVAGSALPSISNLNVYNFLFLFLGVLLHWRPRNLVAAFSRAVPAVAGVLLQFPFYAGMAQVLTHVKNAEGTTLSDTVAGWFVEASADTSVFSILVGAYSAVLGLFIPSAGGKWVVEAPYVMAAANEVEAHLGWTVMIYNIAETLPNFINPFWMLPLLGILALKPRDLVGYTSVQFAFHLPIVLLAGALLMATFEYVPPIIP